MRTITDHKLNGLNDALTITVLDEPGQGGACHEYKIEHGGPYDPFAMIRFQNGPILEAGVNGISGEALLAIVIDRLRSFQAGQYSCRENACALTHIETGLMWLQKRTRDRLARGVEGTNQEVTMSTLTAPLTAAQIEIEQILATATPRSKHWITDAVTNKRNGNGDEISEAADDFVSENGRNSKYHVNRILELLGEEPVFAV